ncbi:hypothetical protein AX15_005163 [Amanita polypyramis BW_CC]|nr:hypothetical protein AX15_005163 [Amanita polypyramis BW_CC]
MMQIYCARWHNSCMITSTCAQNPVTAKPFRNVPQFKQLLTRTYSWCEDDPFPPSFVDRASITTMLSQPALNIATNISNITSSTDCHDVHHYRTTINILQTCVTTIFLCIWVVLHPNVPEDPYDDLEWLNKRIRLMATALFAPEVLLLIAAGSWQGSAACLGRLLRKFPTCKWTEKHAFFAYMGGFRLVGEDGSKEQLKEEQFFDRVINGEIDIPEISSQELSDRSKGDGIAKALVLLQTLWFAIQAANRAIQRLPVTELELTTLAHVFINIFTYWYWWNKPLNIRFSINVYRRSGEKNISMEEAPSRGNSPGSASRREMEENPTTDETTLKVEDVGGPNEQHENELEHFLGDSGDKESQVIQPRLPARVRLGVFLAKVEDHWSWGALVVGFFISVVIGMFGAIHCLAWNSSFPTRIESLLWRISSITIIAIPTGVCAVSILVLVFYGYSAIKIPDTGWTAVEITIISLAIPYIFARTCLLVIALTSLRALPEKAFLIPSWTLYIPHFT